MRIKKQKPRIDAEHALDLLGADFKGDHVAGLAEWLKNSADAYIREDAADDDMHIVIDLRLPARKADWSIAVIDFVGLTYDEIYESLMVWCDPNAASKGGKFDVYGGHGNGGKFHMRENFKTAELWGYRNGKLTAFGFEDKAYGFDPKFEGAEVEPRKAIKEAELDLNVVPKAVRERFDRGDISFTLVRGVGPTPPPKWRTWREFVEKVQRHGQAKQLLDRCPVAVAVNGKIEIADLDAPKIPAKPGFEKARELEIPARLPLDGDEVALMRDGSSPGTLTLRVAAEPFSARGADASLNAIDIKGKVGVIASYRVQELGVANVIGSQFIYGECRCPVLEQIGCKENDRKRLAENDYSLALVRWIADRVDELADKLIEHADKEKMAQHAAVTQRFNAMLNKWKNQFLDKLFVEVTGGPGVGPGYGGTGGGGGPVGNGKGAGGRQRAGEGEGGGGAGDDPKKRAPKYPVVLVSGIDKDPDSQEVFYLDARHPVVYQRPNDVPRNIWWINHQRPLAEKLMAGGPTSERYRDYLLQRYVDILQTYLVGQRWKETIEPQVENVTDWMIESVGRLHDAAWRDLDDYLFGKAARNGQAEA